MLFSIVIPMYNAELYVSSCLDSIFSQGIDPNIYEIIIVNDGSTDNSCELVNQYQREHRNIRLYSQENKGQSAARNFGMQKAKGRFIQFIDIDDFLIPESLHYIVEFGMKDEAPAFDMITFGILGGNPNEVFKNDGNGRCVYKGNGFDYIATHNYNNGPWYYWLNRDFVAARNLHFEVGKLCEDGIFTLTALLNAKRIARIDSNVYYYAIRPNSTTTTTNAERMNKIIDGFEYAVEYFNKTIEQNRNLGGCCRERILNRRDSYAFFLLIRILKWGGYVKAKSVTERLRSENIYPLREFPGKDYASCKFKIITHLLNIRPLYLALCKLTELMKKQ